jgi:hypothetical protein
LLPRELLWIQFSERANDFNACLKWVKRVSIDDVQLRTATKFTGELVKRRLKIIFAEENAWQS